MLGVSVKNSNITLLRWPFFGFRDNIVLVYYDIIGGWTRNIMLE